MADVTRKRKLEALRQMRCALPPAPRAIADLALVVVSLFSDQQPVGVQLTWVRSGDDSVSALSRTLSLPERLRDSAAVGPVHEVSYLALYLGRDTDCRVRVVPPVVEDATWDLIVSAVSPADCAVWRPEAHSAERARRMVLRGVQRQCEFIVGRCEFGCMRLAEEKEKV